MSSSKSDEDMVAVRRTAAQLEGMRKELIKVQKAMEKRDRKTERKELEAKIEKMEVVFQNERRDRWLDDERKERLAEKKETVATLEKKETMAILENERRERLAEKKEMMAALEKPTCKISAVNVAKCDPFAEEVVAEFDPFAEASDNEEILSREERFQQELDKADTRAKKKTELALAAQKKNKALALFFKRFNEQPREVVIRVLKCSPTLSEDEEQELGFANTALSGSIYGLRYTLPLPEGSPLQACAMPSKRRSKNKAGMFPAIRSVHKFHDAQCSLADSRRVVGTVTKNFVKKFGFIKFLGREVFFHFSSLKKGDTMARHSVVEFTVAWDPERRKQKAYRIKVVEGPKKRKLLKGQVTSYDSRSGVGFITPHGATEGASDSEFFFMHQDVKSDLKSAGKFIDSGEGACELKGCVVEFYRGKFATPEGRPRACELCVTDDSMASEVALPRIDAISAAAGSRYHGHAYTIASILGWGTGR
jgi:cold shock CspA family protein